MVLAERGQTGERGTGRSRFSWRVGMWKWDFKAFSTLEMVMVRVVDDDVDNNDDDKSLVPSGEPQPQRHLVAHKADRGDEPTGPTGFCRFWNFQFLISPPKHPGCGWAERGRGFQPSAATPLLHPAQLRPLLLHKQLLPPTSPVFIFSHRDNVARNVDDHLGDRDDDVDAHGEGDRPLRHRAGFRLGPRKSGVIIICLKLQMIGSIFRWRYPTSSLSPQRPGKMC